MVYRRYSNAAAAHRPTADEVHKAHALGKWGEDMAVQYLQGKGYTIIERNYRKGHLEIDIISRNQDGLIFVEVKTRSSDTFAQPEDSVNHKKRKDLMRIANQYVISHHITDYVQFDVITIVHNASGTKIEHFENAFSMLNY